MGVIYRVKQKSPPLPFQKVKHLWMKGANTVKIINLWSFCSKQEPMVHARTMYITPRKCGLHFYELPFLSHADEQSRPWMGHPCRMWEMRAKLPLCPRECDPLLSPFIRRVSLSSVFHLPWLESIWLLSASCGKTLDCFLAIGEGNKWILMSGERDTQLCLANIGIVQAEK